MSWISPFSLPGIWLKGNLHTHTRQSDGALTPEEAIEWYRSHGYDFIAISDHWVLTPGSTLGAAGDFLTITGAELHGPGYHLLTAGLRELPPAELADDPQQLIDAVVAQGALAFIAHPYWTGQTSADIAVLHDLNGLEVYNSVCERVLGLGLARVHWDDLLSQGKRLNALAVDDVHWYMGEQGQGYVMVRAERADEVSILAALRAGHFYASTGPKIADLHLVTDGEGQPALRVQCSPCRYITFHAAGPNGRRFCAEADACLEGATLPLRTEQIYLRVECEDWQGGVAWSNALFVSDVLG